MTPASPALLAEALNRSGLAGRQVGPGDLHLLPAAGVAHHHVAIAGTGRLVRLPRLSQTGRAAGNNLAYQAACFTRAGPSGVTPLLHGILPVSPGLPMGGLVVDRIDGRTIRLPGDLRAVARCLAAIHRLPVPDLARLELTRPLPVQADPVAATLAVIADQAGWLDGAGLDPASVAIICTEVAVAGRARWPAAPPALTLVVTDSHPGNYLVDDAGKAWFVDLEKAAYGQPAIDVAHVTLPTSMGWDRRVTGTATALDVADFESSYLAELPAAMREQVEPWLGPMRRLTWLRTVTWFARWLTRSSRDGDPWSAADLPAALSAHMQAHVRASLAPGALERLQASLPAWGESLP